jgi:hypothetical protein
LIQLNDLIESKNIKDSEFLLDQLQKKLTDRSDLEEESKKLKVFKSKLDQLKANISEIQLPERTDSELLSFVITEIRDQHKTLKSIDWSLKFFVILTLIGFLLWFLSLFI